LIKRLGRELPRIGVGKVSFGQTVHWQPNYRAALEGKPEVVRQRLEHAEYKNTRHENHFAALHGPVFFRWPSVDLSSEQSALLATLLAEVTYFGRAESLCHAGLCETEPGTGIGWCEPPANGGRRISAACRDVFCPDPAHFRFADLWSRRVDAFAPDCPDAPPHLVDKLLASDMKADGAAWFSYQMPKGWPQDWLVRTPRTARRTNKPSPSEGPKVAHYLCFSLECRVPIHAKFIVPLSERFRAAANAHLCRIYDNGTPSFALFGHERPPDIVGDHQHAFYLPMEKRLATDDERDDSERSLRYLHIWCPYGFTQAEVEILMRVNRLVWGSGRYPVRPVLTALSKVPPDDAPFATGKTRSKLWHSASPFVPPRYFYRRERGKVTLKEKDRPERQLIECFRAAGVTTGGQVWRQAGTTAPCRLETIPPLPNWEVVRAPGEDEESPANAVAIAVHQNSSSGKGGLERRIGMFFEIEFDQPVALPHPAFGHSSHFGLGLFVPARFDQP
jgi:CRISPR-associated protein Csb2